MSSKIDTGERRQRKAHRQIRSANPEVFRSLQRDLVKLLLELGCVTPDDLRERRQLPDNVNPTIYGAVFKWAVVAELIVLDRYVHSRRPEARARPMGSWRAVDRQVLYACLRQLLEPVVLIDVNAIGGPLFCRAVR